MTSSRPAKISRRAGRSGVLVSGLAVRAPPLPTLNARSFPGSAQSRHREGFCSRRSLHRRRRLGSAIPSARGVHLLPARHVASNPSSSLFSGAGTRVGVRQASVDPRSRPQGRDHFRPPRRARPANAAGQSQSREGPASGLAARLGRPRQARRKDVYSIAPPAPMALPLASWLVRFQRGALMFIATALLYPCALAALCLGTGLLVDRCSRPGLAAPLLLPVGAAGLIAVSQLSTYAYPLAPATPYLVLAVALAGFSPRPAPAAFWPGGAGAARLLASMRRRAWLPAASLLAYLIALAPVLAAGRTTFSSFMVLSDSAVHLIGADFLIRHGQHYAHLDLRNSYGQFINDYYNTSYPSGSDTLFGGSAMLLRLPLIWAFQPFNAFMLATAVGPAWMLARRMRLEGAWAALAALTAVLPAVVYAYELFGSVARKSKR